MSQKSNKSRKSKGTPSISNDDPFTFEDTSASANNVNIVQVSTKPKKKTPNKKSQNDILDLTYDVTSLIDDDEVIKFVESLNGLIKRPDKKIQSFIGEANNVDEDSIIHNDDDDDSEKPSVYGSI